QVAVIATPGSTPAALAAKAATDTIPIVFATGADPIALGLVPGLSRPGGNVTGITSLNAEVAAKRLAVCRELVPQTVRYFALVNPTSPLTEPTAKELQDGAETLGVEIVFLRASSDQEIEAAFERIPREPGSLL